MDRRLRYHSLFTKDVVDAADWYDAKSRGLGDALVERVADATGHLIAHPEHYAKGLLGLRCVRVAKFPFVVLFDWDDGELLILGLFHTAMSTERWRERMRDS